MQKIEYIREYLRHAQISQACWERRSGLQLCAGHLASRACSHPPAPPFVQDTLRSAQQSLAVEKKKVHQLNTALRHSRVQTDRWHQVSPAAGDGCRAAVGGDRTRGGLPSTSEPAWLRWCAVPQELEAARSDNAQLRQQVAALQQQLRQLIAPGPHARAEQERGPEPGPEPEPAPATSPEPVLEPEPEPGQEPSFWLQAAGEGRPAQPAAASFTACQLPGAEEAQPVLVSVGGCGDSLLDLMSALCHHEVRAVRQWSWQCLLVLAHLHCFRRPACPQLAPTTRRPAAADRQAGGAAAPCQLCARHSRPAGVRE